jgi:hypothetical protein
MVRLFCWLEKLNRWMRAGLSPSWVHRLCTSSSTVISSSCTQLSHVTPLSFFDWSALLLLRISTVCCNLVAIKWGRGGEVEGKRVGPTVATIRCTGVLYSQPTSLLFQAVLRILIQIKIRSVLYHFCRIRIRIYSLSIGIRIPDRIRHV